YSVPAIFSVEIKTVDANYKQWLEESLSNTDNQ
ncbi:MAG TPA: divalent-cation tolerance protein CutA, partial [Pseudothermotoga sp.]|nr:divalent-cation tolerance protein CutA [Pseudothermotoga sp.]